MDAVEVQLQRLTAASEENQNQVTKLEARLAALEAAANPPAAVAAAPAASPAASGPTVLLPKAADETPKLLAKPPAKPLCAALGQARACQKRSASRPGCCGHGYRKSP